MPCEGRVVGARRLYLLSVDEISEVKKARHSMVFSELGSLDFETSSKLVLFVIYNYQSRWCQLTVTRSPVPPQAQAFAHACQNYVVSVSIAPA